MARAWVAGSGAGAAEVNTLRVPQSWLLLPCKQTKLQPLRRVLLTNSLRALFSLFTAHYRLKYPGAMSLSGIYQNFLRSPTEAALAPDAALNYISTLSTFHDAASVVKHLIKQQENLKKKKENVLSTTEGNNSVCLEIETTLEFVNGGGAYLPGLDDNFLADRTVTLPIVSLPVRAPESAC